MLLSESRNAGPTGGKMDVPVERRAGLTVAVHMAGVPQPTYMKIEPIDPDRFEYPVGEVLEVQATPEEMNALDEEPPGEVNVGSGGEGGRMEDERRSSGEIPALIPAVEKENLEANVDDLMSRHNTEILAGHLFRQILTPKTFPVPHFAETAVHRGPVQARSPANAANPVTSDYVYITSSSSVTPPPPAGAGGAVVGTAFTWKARRHEKKDEELRTEDIPECVRKLLGGDFKDESWRRSCIAYCTYEAEAGSIAGSGAPKSTKWWTIVKRNAD